MMNNYDENDDNATGNSGDIGTCIHKGTQHIRDNPRLNKHEQTNTWFMVCRLCDIEVKLPSAAKRVLSKMIVLWHYAWGIGIMLHYACIWFRMVLAVSSIMLHYARVLSLESTPAVSYTNGTCACVAERRAPPSRQEARPRRATYDDYGW